MDKRELRKDHLTSLLVDIGCRMADSDPNRMRVAALVMARGNVPFVVAHRVLVRKIRRGNEQTILVETVFATRGGTNGSTV